MRELFDFTGRRVWVAGHAGMVGSAVVRRLAREGCEILTVGRKDLDLRRQSKVEDWMEANRPDAVVLAAGRVGGIVANSSLPGDFIYDNLAIAANVIHAARGCGVTRLLYLGSSCIYPKLAEQPMTEGALLTGPLEPSNEWYAVAKIAGVKLCQAYRLQHGCDFISAMPTNLYGPGDTYDEAASHVIPALMLRMHRAAAAGADAVTIWGSGAPPLRRFRGPNGNGVGALLGRRRRAGRPLPAPCSVILHPLQTISRHGGGRTPGGPVTALHRLLVASRKSGKGPTPPPRMQSTATIVRRARSPGNSRSDSTSLLQTMATFAPWSSNCLRISRGV